MSSSWEEKFDMKLIYPLGSTPWEELVPWEELFHKIIWGDNPAKTFPSWVPWKFNDVIMASYPPNFQDLRVPNLGTQLIIIK